METLIDLIQTFDISVISAVYAVGRTDLFDAIAVLFSFIGTFRAGIITVGLFLMFKKETRRIAYILFAAALLSGIIVWIIKEIADRPRPFIELGIAEADLLVRTSPYRSFPSGHAASAFTGAAVVGYYFRRWIIPAAILAGIAGLARIYLLLHYPSDVVFGAAIGIVAALAGIMIFEKQIKTRNPRKTENCLIR